MARSAHAYVRGSTAKFYEWLEDADRSSLPAGPAIWICGDCHLSNLGPVASLRERVELQIRDLDQTVIGNPAHDLIRLALSLAMAARGSDLSGVITAEMIEALMRGYLSALVDKVDDLERPPPIKLSFESALRRSWRELHLERLGRGRPTLPIGARFWPLSAKERKDILRLGETPELQELVTKLACREDGASVKVLDAAYWVKGCSSLGLWRAAVLVNVGGKKLKATEGGLCILDVKQATSPMAPRGKNKLPHHNGERVVTGARILSPHLGNRMISATVAGHPVFVRELLPQDLKVEITRLDESHARKLASFLGAVVGRAHRRQLPDREAASWRKELERRTSKAIEAPTWLWSSVVDLVGFHEGAYLEHCRRFALDS